jgi:hypothetical protein
MQGARGNTEQRCSNCGAGFHCGVDDPNGCWCARQPPLPLTHVRPAADCLCPECLAAELDALGQQQPGA